MKLDITEASRFESRFKCFSGRTVTIRFDVSRSYFLCSFCASLRVIDFEIIYMQDLKVMKVRNATETKCYVTPLDKSSPMDVPKMKTDGVQVTYHKENAHSLAN